MVIFVLTKEGFDEMMPLIQTGKYPVWLSDGVLSEEEIDLLIPEDLEISYFNYVVDLEDEEALASAMFTIAEHHSGERIWVESKLKNPFETG